MEMTKKVSVVIPAYNSERFIREAVESALQQTHTNTEVVVVDDGSDDNTREVIEPYIRRKEIVCVSQPNRGLSAARNAGIAVSRGDFIALLDSDDLFLPNKVERQLNILEDHPDFDVCYSDILHFTDEEPRRYYHHRYHEIYASGNILERLLKKNFINPLTVFARKSVFKKHGFFDERLRRSEDLDLWLRWAYRGVKFYFLDEILAHYRIRKLGNLTSLQSEPKMKEENIRLFTNFFENLSEAEKRTYGHSSIFFDLEQKAAAAYLFVGDKRSALMHLKKSRERKLTVSFLFYYVFILCLPARLLKFIAATVRNIKHRSLLVPYRLRSGD